MRIVTTMLSAVALTATPAFAQEGPQARVQSVTWYLAFVDCLKNRTVTGGAFTKEDPLLVAQRAVVPCASQWATFEDTVLQGRTADAQMTDTLTSLRETAVGEAARDLVAARYGSVGTGSLAQPKK